MTWTMPPETFRQDRIWMAFPREGETLGAESAAREAGYAAWTAVAHAIAEFEPVTMIVDPSEMARAKHMLGGGIEIVERVIDDFWLRDSGPTFVHAADDLGNRLRIEMRVARILALRRKRQMKIHASFQPAPLLQLRQQVFVRGSRIGRRLQHHHRALR